MIAVVRKCFRRAAYAFIKMAQDARKKTMTLHTQMTEATETPAAIEQQNNGFELLGLPSEILKALARINFTTPTPIQQKTIPLAITGRDILGTAQTGTGKTAAFTIPMLAHLINNKTSIALIVAPTRELASQIQQAVMQMEGRLFDIRTALLIGGDSMGKQMDALRRSPRVIIGTPGRINDHLNRRSLNLSKTDYLVLDETDRMLDMGFGVQIDKILQYMPGKRQTMLFSATLPSYITKMADKYMNDAVRISAGSTTTASTKITQETINVSAAEKYGILTGEISKRTGSVIVFVKTKRGADRLADKLEKDNISVDAIHGNLSQNRRTKVIRDFRNGQIRVLVATDVAARGLDIPHIEHVINYDLPQCPEDYIHRIGRTGRNGAEGFSLSFISGEDGAKWNAIQRLMNPGTKSNDDRPNRRPEHKGKGGGFKHKRKEWAGPRRHRHAVETDAPKPNKGRYIEGDTAPQRDEARKEVRSFDKPKFEKRGYPKKSHGKFDRDFARNPESRPERNSERNEDRQPRENRDSWGNSSNRSHDEGRPQYRESNREGNREFRRDDRPKKSFGDKPRFEQRDQGDGERQRYQGKRPFNKDGNRDGARSDRPWSNRPKRDGERPQGERPAFKKGGFKKSFGGGKPNGKPRFEGKPGGFKKRFSNDAA